MSDLPDVIDQLAAIAPGSPLDAIRARRQVARDHAQKSYLALFEPKDFAGVPALERFAVAAFVAGLHAEPATRDFYAAKLARPRTVAIAAAVEAETARGRTQGPYGSYPAGPLSRENSTGLIYRVSDEARRSSRRTARRGVRACASACVPACAMPIRPRCRPCSMPAGRPTTSSRCRNSSPSCRSRFAPSAACARSPPRPRARERRNAMTDTVITHPDNKEPTAFTQKELGWLPWLEPLAAGRLHRTPSRSAGRRGAHQVALFPPAGARSRHS